jgi:hypothetical protein
MNSNKSNNMAKRKYLLQILVGGQYTNHGEEHKSITTLVDAANGLNWGGRLRLNSMRYHLGRNWIHHFDHKEGKWQKRVICSDHQHYPSKTATQ